MAPLFRASGPLEGIDDIPWKTLETAFGSASAVPALLSKLAAADPKKVDRGWEEMDEQILWHQGSVYSATAAAVPFIARIAALPHAHRRPRLISFLAWCSLGRDVPYSPAGTAARARQAVRESLPRLRLFLAGSDRAQGLALAELSAALPFDLAAARPIVTELFSKETKLETQSALAGALAMLGDRSPRVIDLLLQTEDEDDLFRDAHHAIMKWATESAGGAEDDRFFAAAYSVHRLFYDDAVYYAP